MLTRPIHDLALAAALGCALAACGADSAASDASVSDSSVDARVEASADVTSGDASGDTGVPRLQVQNGTAPVMVGGDGQRAQINGASVVLDGSWVLAYSAAEPAAQSDTGVDGGVDAGVGEGGIGDAGNFDTQVDAEVDAAFDAESSDAALVPIEDSPANLRIWLTRRSFDGTVLYASTRIDTAGGNCGSPTVAIGGTGEFRGVLVAWLCSNVPGTRGNFEVHYRLFDTSLRARTSDLTLSTLRDGQLVRGAHAFPTVAGTSNGFWIAASREGGAAGFRGCVQRLTLDGTSEGDAAEWPSVGASEEHVAVAARGGGWSALFVGGDEVYHVSDQSGPIRLGPGEQPVVAANGAAVWGAYVRTPQRDIALYDISAAIRTAPTHIIAVNSRPAFTPAVALDGNGGGLISWFQNTGSASGPILGARFSTSAFRGDYLLLDRSARLSYASALVFAGGDRFIMGWSEGPSSALAFWFRGFEASL